MYLNIKEFYLLIFVGVGILFAGFYYFSLKSKISKLEFEFTSIVNHVFRTPLTRIMWITKELEKNLDKKESGAYLQNIENATSRVLDIVDIIAGIKDIKNIGGYFFQAISIREIIEKSLLKYREQVKSKNITFSVDNFKDVPLLTVDLKKISFVIDVLIENAIFYTPQNGQISIETKVGSRKLTIAVADNGIGLNFKEKRRVFSKFYRGKEARRMYTDGMGLGLYLSKIIVSRHGGRIYVKSKGRNKGSIFFLELPFVK